MPFEFREIHEISSLPVVSADSCRRARGLSSERATAEPLPASFITTVDLVNTMSRRGRMVSGCTMFQTAMGGNTVERMASGKSRFTRVCDLFFDLARHRDAWESASSRAATSFEGLRGHKYALLTSYRKNGQAIPSPVWFGMTSNGAVFFASEAGAPKVRRMANNPRVRFAPCDARGKPLGPAVIAVARILPAEEHSHAERVIAANYGMGRKLYELLFRRLQVYAYIELTKDPCPGSAVDRGVTSDALPNVAPLKGQP